MAALSSAALALTGCGSTALVSTPIENIDTVPLKVSELSEEASKRWGHADLMQDTIPGMSVDRRPERAWSSTSNSTRR